MGEHAEPRCSCSLDGARARHTGALSLTDGLRARARPGALCKARGNPGWAHAGVCREAVALPLKQQRPAFPGRCIQDYSKWQRVEAKKKVSLPSIASPDRRKEVSSACSQRGRQPGQSSSCPLRPVAYHCPSAPLRQLRCSFLWGAPGHRAAVQPPKAGASTPFPIWESKAQRSCS